MEISASVTSAGMAHSVQVQTAGSRQSIAVAAKANGQGSAVNGGEFLMLALATCYSNDLYREASRVGITLHEVSVEASADFPGIGLAATNIRYKASARSDAPAQAVAKLMRATDAVAEVHNTLRAGPTAS